MKRILFALMAVAAIATAGSISGCNGPANEPDDPEPPENIPSRLDTTPPQTEIDGRRVNAPLRFPGVK